MTEEMYDVFTTKLRLKLQEADVSPTKTEDILHWADKMFRIAFTQGKNEAQVETTT